MVRSTRFLALATLAPAFIACSSSEATRKGGPSVNAEPPSEDRVVCSEYYVSCPSGIEPGGGALASLDSARPYAEASEKNAAWNGTFWGHAIDRKGRPTTASQSAWAFQFCSAETGNLLEFAVTKAGCSAIDVCGKKLPCSAAVELPKIDADAAIAAAFPGDPGSTLYEVVLSPKYGHRWLVAQKDKPDLWIPIDADTGAVSP